jgi:hypothetical protein
MILSACGGNEGNTEQPSVSTPGNPPTTNRIPTISGTPATSVLQDSIYGFTPSAIDPDGDHLTFSITSKPDWASFNPSTGTLTGNPDNSNVGAASGIVISVSDGEVSTSLSSFSITVIDVNDAPNINGSPSAYVPKETTYSFIPAADDPDGDDLTFSITNKPAWAAFDPLTGRLTGTPSSSDNGVTFSNIIISASDGQLSASLPTFSITVTEAPRILYTDIVSGPNSGGENNNGAYLRLFGYYFGSAGELGSTTKVYVNDVEVANYKGLRNAKAQPFMGQLVLQEIAVQVGALGNPAPGTPLPIKVVHNGASSNTDHSFTVQPGDMIYVALTGSDSTGDGSFANPYRLVQNPTQDNPAWSAFGPGDTIVLRGGTWNDAGWSNRFARFDQNKNGTAPNGLEGNGYYTIMAYPGEEAVISLTYAAGNHKGGISGASSSFYADNHYVAISSLTIHDDDPTKPDNSGGGPINAQTSGEYWRVVNNELSARIGQTVQRAASITGGYRHAALLGNYIHDVQGLTTGGSGNHTNHGVYIDNYSSSFELAYNHIENADGGSGIQFHGNLGSSCGYPDCDIASFTVHHNLINGAAKHGMNYSWLVTNGSVYNNMIMNVAMAGLRFASTDINGLYVVHNTFFNINTTFNSNIGALQWEGSAADVNLYVENNIFSTSASSAQYYLNYMSSGADAGLTLNNNLWYGLGTAAPSKDGAPVSGAPLFVSTSPPSEDLRIQVGSPAIDTGTTLVDPLTDDFFFNSRIDASDVGAHEGG